MSTAPPAPATTNSPLSICRWKRGRPVQFKGGNPRLFHQTQKTPQQASPQLVADPSLRSETRLTQPKRARHSQVWNLSNPIRFASATNEHSCAVSIATTKCSIDGATLGLANTSYPDKLAQDKADLDASQDNEHGGISLDAEVDGLHAQELSSSQELLVDPSQHPNYSTQGNSDNEFDGDNETDVAEDDDILVEEEHARLEYQIPKEVMSAAILATPNTRASFYNTKFYRGPNEETISIHYCQNVEVAERVAKYFLTEKIVGFDIEWKPWGHAASIKQNVSLIQLACENRIALFHLSKFAGRSPQQLMPRSLKMVLESPDIYKVGVAVKGDFSRLRKYLEVEARGVFELSRLYNLVEWYDKNPSKISNKLVGLAAQVLQHLQLPLYKGTPLDDEPEVTSSVRQSDWSKSLNPGQIQYAAADAYAGFRLYDILEWKRKQLRPIPPPVATCDGDQAPKPRVARRKSKTSDVEAETQVAADGQVIEEAEEIEDNEELDGYETTSEDLRDSDQQTDHLLITPSKSNLGSLDEGRIDFPRPELTFRFDSELAYPILPHNHSQESSKACSSQTTDSLPRHFSTVSLEENTQSQKSKGSQLDEVDEFADSELEEILLHLDINSDGDLRVSAGQKVGVPHTNGSDMADVRATTKEEQNGVKHWLENTSSASYKSNLLPTSINSGDFTAHKTIRITLSAAATLMINDSTNDTSEYDVATAWAKAYLHLTTPSPTSPERPRIHATVPHLRAYHMWMKQALPLDHITACLRDPPLAASTVSGYVLQAISLEKLEYDEVALKALMASLPSNLRKGKWRDLAQKVGALG